MVDLIATEKRIMAKFRLGEQYGWVMKNTLTALIGFSMGRVVILDFLNPFSIALLCASMTSKLNPYLIGMSIIAGSLSLKNPQLLLRNIILVSLITFIYIMIKKSRLNQKAFYSIFAPLANLITGSLIFYINNYYLYDMFMIIIESIMLCALINIYDKGINFFMDIKKRTRISAEEVVSILLLIMSAFLGSTVYIGILSIKNILSITIILLASYMGNIGTGAATGTVFGLLQALSGDIYPSAIGVYGICGVLAAAFKPYGRIMSILGFIAGNSLMTFYINGSTEVLISFEEILAASMVFLMIPNRKIKDFLTNRLGIETSGYRNAEVYRIKDYTVERLQEISDLFKELALSLSSGLGDREYFSQIDAAEIMEKVAKDVCYECGMYKNCWKREFYGTYQKMFSALSRIEKGDLKESEIADCLFPEKVWNRLKYYYDLYRYTVSWKKKIDNSRYALSHQLKETSKLIGGLANRFNANLDFDKALEEEIFISMDKIGLRLNNVTALKGKNSVEIDIRLPNCGGKRVCVSKIIPEVRRITGKHFVKMDTSCCIKGKDECWLKLREAHKFSIVTGIARKQKQTSSISGDNYSLIELKDGKFVMILSDGMGSGPRAAMESGMAVNLIEKFLTAGYDQNTALEAVNSLLLINSDDDNYATVDMTIINQYTGDVEFLKVGAVSTFIKYKDRVDIIRNSSLPAGIMDKIDVEFNRRKVGDGDFVVMITDGVLEANDKDLDKEKWLADIIYETDTRNPKKLADIIMEKCMEKSKGQLLDDMTVLVAKIWKSA